MEKIFNISNSLSFFRLLLSVPLIFFLMNDDVFAVLILFILAYISDLLDGFFARKLNQITEIGKIIDPLADKIFVSVLVIILMIKGYIPFWFFIIVLLRDILILLGGLYISSKQKKVPASNIYGKITVFIIGLTLLLSYLKIFSSSIILYCYILASIGIVISFTVYFKNFILIIKK